MKDKSTPRYEQLKSFIEALEEDFYKVYVKQKGKGEAGKRLRRNFRYLKVLLDDIRKESLTKSDKKNP